MKKEFLFIFAIGLMIACKSTGPLKSENKELFSIGDTSVSAEEFQYVYNKNNINRDSAFNRADVEDYLDLFIKFKLKVKEAKALKLDQKASFKQELEGYRKQLAKPYLTESKVTDLLVKEAYDRMKTEVNVSHILINAAPNAAPADSIVAFNKIDSIRNAIVAGNISFANAAKQFSQDPSARNNAGDLGYFSAFQMVYPFESASYNTQKGEVSEPFRTRFGYHIVDVKDKRASRGKVKVAHIMIRSNEAMPEEVKKQHREKIEEIHKQLLAGEDWNQLCGQFSQDLGTNKKGGLLPWIGTGNVDPIFESAAFGLQKKGDISSPVLSPYGWHIIRLDDKQLLSDYETLAPELKEKIKKDSRSRLSKKVLVNRLKSENAFVANDLIVQNALNNADSSLLQAKWHFDSTASILPEYLFTIKGIGHRVDSFYSYVADNQKPRRGLSPKDLMQNYYDNYVENSLTSYEESQLSAKYVDYRMLLKEYHEGILLFELMDQKVWTKAIKDTVGLKQFYDQNQRNYQWKERVDAIIFDAANQAILDEIKQARKGPYFEVKLFALKLNTEAGGKSNSAGDNNIITVNQSGIDDIINKLVNDKTGSKTTISGGSGNFQKIQSIKEYMLGKGVSPQSVEVQKEDSEGIDIKLWKNSPKALEQKFNAVSPLNLQVDEGLFEKADKPVLEKIDWKVGESEVVNLGNRYYWAIVKDVLPPQTKALEEIKGIVISDYQNKLETDWVEQLKLKYPVKKNKQAFENVVSNLEK